MTDSYINPGKAKSNVEAVAEMFAIHGDFLLSVFKKEVSDHDARDLWQNLFLTLTTRSTPVNRKNVRRFLYQAAVHDIIDFKRRTRLHEKKNNEYADIARRTQSSRSPLQQLVSIESVAEAFKKIEENLPPTIGQVILHKFRKQLSHRQIAKKMNIKKQTVDTYLSVGTKMLVQLEGVKK
ncbi:MAG: sigma-70 family RNA polymerase sigma factor [Phycisphaerae bacterium]|nr:sigma-70 family RNA polymerase sigma factor [Phycisphaerae bacterium]